MGTPENPRWERGDFKEDHCIAEELEGPVKASTGGIVTYHQRETESVEENRALLVN